MICVSLADIDSSQIQSILDREDLVELRLDLLDDVDPVRMCAHRADVVATMRPKSGVSDLTRLEILKGFIAAGAEYIDCEFDAPDSYQRELVDFARRYDCKVIISYHNFIDTPPSESLLEIITRARQLGGSIVKIACQANSIRDGLRLLSLLDDHSNLVIIGMGEYGKLARVLSPLLGGLFTYASADDDRLTAPGQISAAKLRAVYEQLAQIGFGQNGNLVL
jgi:3-dehydroquinate dehydratase-1